MRKPKRTSAEMFPLVEQYLQGGQSLKIFCAEHNISVSQLYYWRRKYRAQRQGEAFLEVSPPAACERAVMEVVYPDGVRLRLFVPAPPSFFVSLLQGEGVSA